MGPGLPLISYAFGGLATIAPLGRTADSMSIHPKLEVARNSVAKFPRFARLQAALRTRSFGGVFAGPVTDARYRAGLTSSDCTGKPVRLSDGEARI
jgi:hypothetical protein